MLEDYDNNLVIGHKNVLLQLRGLVAIPRSCMRRMLLLPPCVKSHCRRTAGRAGYGNLDLSEIKACCMCDKDDVGSHPDIFTDHLLASITFYSRCTGTTLWREKPLFCT